MLITKNKMFDLESIGAKPLPNYEGLMVKRLPFIELISYFPKDSTLKSELQRKLDEYGKVRLEVIQTLQSIEDKEYSELPLVSIVTPTYNAEKYIEATLRSITQQSYPNYEVIIVDDGSSDSTLEIIKRIISKKHSISKATLVKLPHIGVPAVVRNFALYNLLSNKSKFLTFMDDDDVYYEHDSLGKLASPLVRNNYYTCSYGAYDFIDQNGNKIAGAKMLRKTSSGSLEWRKRFMITWSNIAKKRMVSFHLQSFMVRLPTPAMPYYMFGSEDAVYFARVIHHTADVCAGELDGIFHVPAVIFHYRKRTTSYSSKLTDRPLSSSNNKRESTQKIPEFYKESGIPEKFITHANLAEFAASKWLPRIYNAFYKLHIKEAVRLIKRALKEPNLNLYYLLILFFKDLMINPLYRDLILSKFKKII